MSEFPAKIGIVSLGEAGNLGDDLILIAAMEAIYRTYPNASVRYLSFGEPIDWTWVRSQLGFRGLPAPVRDQIEIPFFRNNSDPFRGCDVVIFGGGGLIQTSHSPDRPYEWFSYLPPSGEDTPRVLAVGIGLGPVNSEWSDKLQQLGSPFDSAWVRDPDSLVMANRKFAWEAKECRDFVDSEFLFNLLRRSISARHNGSLSVLGVALRQWPGLEAADVAAHIDKISQVHDIDFVEFFVLEAKRSIGPDVDFTREVASLVASTSEIHIYRGTHIEEFIGRMAKVDVGISMKLHSSAIWAAVDVPMYPIFYAPKVAAFFGDEYKGLELSTTIRTPRVDTDVTPRSADVIKAVLPDLVQLRASSGHRFPFGDRLLYQVRRLARSLLRRVGVRK